MSNSNDFVWWNGRPLPVPAAPVQYTYRDIEGKNSGYTLGGDYSKKVIARKEDVLMQWQGLSEDEAKIISEVKSSAYGTLTYFSPRQNKFISKTMYTEDLSAEIKSAAYIGEKLTADISSAVKFREK